jgi:AcrR family transcriptional regulator
MAVQAGRRRRTGRRTGRVYRQDLRARQLDANTSRIVDAAAALVSTVRRVADITLDDIAAGAGLTARTILRRFGSRDGVLEAAFERLKTEFQGLRRPTPPGDVDAAVASVVGQYEQIGDFNIRALEAEDQLALVHRSLDYARAFHRAWLADVFAPNLARLTPSERERRLIALYAATDIYLWKLLRRDLSLDRKHTEDTFGRLVRGVLT